jgi:WD40 repeat protein
MIGRRGVLRGLGGLFGSRILSNSAVGLGVTGCAEVSGRTATGLRVHTSWQIPLGDAPRYAFHLAWAPDSRRLAVGGGGPKGVSFWDAREVRRLPGPEDQRGNVDALAFSPDGRYLAVARPSTERGDQQYYSASIRDAVSGALIQGLVKESGDSNVLDARSVAFSPDSRYLAVGYSSSTTVYSQQDGRWRRAGGLGSGATRVAFSPDGVRLAMCGGYPPRIYLCRVPSLEVLRRWPNVGGPGFASWALAYRPTGGQIAAARGAALGIIAPEDGSLIGELKARGYSFYALAYSPSGRYLVAADSTEIRIFNSENWTEVTTLATSEHYAHELAFSPDGMMLAAAAGPVVRIWEWSASA